MAQLAILLLYFAHGMRTDMRSVSYATQIRKRIRLHCASVLVLIAKLILAITQRLFQLGLFDIAGVKYGIRVSEAIRRVSWRLIHRKAH